MERFSARDANGLQVVNVLRHQHEEEKDKRTYAEERWHRKAVAFVADLGKNAHVVQVQLMDNRKLHLCGEAIPTGCGSGVESHDAMWRGRTKL